MVTVSAEARPFVGVYPVRGAIVELVVHEAELGLCPSVALLGSCLKPPKRLLIVSGSSPSETGSIWIGSNGN